jgi:Cu+-exporting ATPase
MVATGRAAQMGILIKGGEALERLAGVDEIILDKTGTLTSGKPTVVKVWGAPETLRLAAAVEQRSEHPLGGAILGAAGEGLPEATEFLAFAGRGAKAKVEGREVWVGNGRLLAENGWDRPADVDLPEAAAWVWVVDAGQVVGAVALADVPRASSAEAVRQWRDAGLRVSMLSGDREAVAAAVARETGIEHFVAGMLPEDKLRYLTQRRNAGAKVAMVGDGVNDAPALAQAEVGIVMASGSDVAIEAGDVTLLDSDLLAVEKARRLAKACVRAMRQNLFWAFAYNVVCIPVAAGLWHAFDGPALTPVMASGAMALSSVSVVLNSLRLWQVKIR